MPSGNLHGLVVDELLIKGFFNLFIPGEDQSILFSYPLSSGNQNIQPTIPTKMALVRLDASGNVEAYGTPADVDWGVASNGEAANEAAITLVAPSGGANGIALYSEWPGQVPSGPNWIALARLPGNATISGGTSAVFNAGSIRFSWGKATDGTSLDDSTPGLRNKLQGMLVGTPGGQSPNATSLQDLYQPAQHSWLVLFTQDRSSYLASGDLYLKWEFPPGTKRAQNKFVVAITNNSGTSFVAKYAAIFVLGNTSTTPMSFPSGGSGALKILEKELSPTVTIQNGQQLQIPVGQLTVTVS